jgi:hydroxyacyl-ACP dehydratase HTD2-like protein with hotdog domain
MITRLPKVFPRPSLQQYTSSSTAHGASASGTALYDSSPRTVRDLLTAQRVNLLDLTLAPFLPSQLHRTLPPPPHPAETSELPPGHHFIFFPTSTSEKDTLSDGYEKHFAPTYPFARRLWTQGRLEFNNRTTRGLMVREWAVCKEQLEDVVDSSSSNATDVWISRTMFPEGSREEEDEWSVKEIRCLRYLRYIPPSIQQGTSPTASKDYENAMRGAFLVHQFTPSQVLVTRYSYLTFNFHKIHINQNYAQQIEKYPSTLVHGSLSITLILTILRQYYHSSAKDITPFIIKSVKYVMYRPLYVNSQITLTISNAQGTNTDTRHNRHRAILWDSSFKKAVECIIYPFP